MKIKYSFFIFVIHIFENFQTKNKTKKKKRKENLIMTCVSECFESPCHILEGLQIFLHMMGVLIIFREGNSYLVLWVMD
jgi:hypothetical protein